MFAVFTDADQNIQAQTGPIDDGYIANSVGSLPGDPFCCAGPEPLDNGKCQRCSNDSGNKTSHSDTDPLVPCLAAPWPTFSQLGSAIGVCHMCFQIVTASR